MTNNGQVDMMECKFCNIVNINSKTDIVTDKIPVYDTKICETENFIVVPDLGAIIEGYLLVITKKHLNSMAELSTECLHELHFLLNLLCGVTEKIYGVWPILFEHGSAPPETKKISQSSIYHAHMHLVPYIFKNPDIVIKEAEMCLFDGIEYLNNYSGSSYVYFRTQKSKEYITVNRSLPSQYMRQKLAIDVDRGLEWNWREHSFLPNVKKTIQRYQGMIETLYMDDFYFTKKENGDMYESVLL